MSLSRKIKRNKTKDAIKDKSINGLMKASGIAAEIKAREIAAEAVKNSLTYLATAIEGTFKEEYGFGNKRLFRLMQQLNDRLPNYLKFDDVPQRTKIDKDRLYDVIELLLELGCDESCKQCKKYKECKMYKIFSSRYIEPYNIDGKCPYQIIPGKLSKDEIQMLKYTIKARLNY